MSIKEDPAFAPFWIGDAPLAGSGQWRLGLSESFLETLRERNKPLAIVGLELAPAGTRLAAGDALGLMHLPDRAVDLRIPFPLTIVKLNEAALADPRLVAASPYLRGWLAEISREGPAAAASRPDRQRGR